jgi:hypothetical protein
MLKYEFYSSCNALRAKIAQFESLLHIVQTGSGFHPASYPMGKGKAIPVQAVEALRVARG